MENCLMLMFLCYMVKLITSDSVSVRLVNGNIPCAGRVEVYNDGQWGTVCGYGWDIADAAVVCRELDCGTAVNPTYNAHFGTGSGPISMGFVECSGSETALKDCRSNSDVAKWVCNHDLDAGVICSGRHPKLVNGSHLCSGRLEILQENKQYTVCDGVFDQQDAEVVCRELDCGAPVQVLGAAAFDKGDTQMWTQEIQCRGNEYQFALCPASPSQFCSHENNVTVVCAETVRLVGANSRCAGRVEVLHAGQWGTVHHVGWDLPDAAVVCKELDCGEALTAPKGAHFGEGSGKVWISDLQCTGSEFTLTNCRFNGWGVKANHTEDAGVICSDLSVSITPASTTSASPPAASLSVPPVLVIVLGVVLLLLLVPLLILIQQNRVMRRAISNRRHRTMSEAVYEEIQHRRNHFTQRGRLISEELHSGYEEADELFQVGTLDQYDDVIIIGQNFQGVMKGYQEEYDDVKNSTGDDRNQLGSLISEALHSGYEDADELISEEMKQITPGYYDDVITDGLKPDRETEDRHESYDDVMTSEQNYDIKKEGDPEYDDVKNSNEDERNRLDYDDVGEESHKGGGAI